MLCVEQFQPQSRLEETAFCAAGRGKEWYGRAVMATRLGKASALSSHRQEVTTGR